MATQYGSTFSGNNSAEIINQIGNANNVSFNGLIVDERKAFFRWLDFIDFRPDHDTILKKRYEQTSGWILERDEFRDWLESEKPSMLWCWGPPGIGKSVIASIVIDYLRDTCGSQNGAAVAYVYFKHDAGGIQTPAKILRSLIQQLCCNMNEIPMGLLNFYRNCNRNSLEPTYTDLVTEFLRLCDSYQQAFIVLDALDECDKARQQYILEFLSESINKTTNTKIFVTSRHESDIELHLNTIGISFIPIEANDIDNDINSFVHGRVEDKIQQGRLRIKSEFLKAKVISELTTKAQGMFLWVNLQLERLCTQRREYDIEAELSRLPPGLKGTYQRILRQINEQDDKLRNLCKRSLTWVFYATRPLRIEELVHAVSIDEDCHSDEDLKNKLWDIETIREACANLISIEQNVVRPIHFSVREYFITIRVKSPQSVSSFTSNALFAYNHLAQCCLRYLMIKFFNEPCSEATELYNRLDKFPFSCHASYLFDHYILATTYVTSELAACLQQFLKSKRRLLASTLQLRRLEDGRNHILGNFTRYNDGVLPSDIIYSTTLYGSKQLSSASREWDNLVPPRLAFFHALRVGTTSLIILLLEKGHDITECDADGIPPLYIAAQSENVANCHILIERGVVVNAQGGYYGNALQVASVRGNEVIVNLLLQNGADFNVQNGHFGNSLQAASIRGKKAIVSLLLQKGADVNAQGGYYGSALEAAFAHGNEAIVSFLVKSGAEYLESDDEEFDSEAENLNSD